MNAAWQLVVPLVSVCMQPAREALQETFGVLRFLTKNLSSDSLADLCGIALKTGTPLLNEELLSYPARKMPPILQEISGIFLWFPIYHVSLPDAMNWRLYCFMKLDAAMVWL